MSCILIVCLRKDSENCYFAKETAQKTVAKLVSLITPLLESENGETRSR